MNISGNDAWFVSFPTLAALSFAIFSLGFMLYLSWRLFRHRRRHRPYWERQQERRRVWGYE